MTIETAFSKVKKAEIEIIAARKEFWGNGGYNGADRSNLDAATANKEAAWIEYLVALRSNERPLTDAEKCHNYFGMCDIAV